MAAIGADLRAHEPTKRWRLPEGLGSAIPAVVLVVILTLVPLARIVGISLEDGFGAYRELFGSGTFWASTRVTFEIAITVTGICLVLGYPVAYVLASAPRRLAGLVLGLVMLTFWISVLVRIYAWMAILGRNGLANRFLQAVGLTDGPLPLLFGRPGVLVGMVHYLLPYMILALYGGFVGIDRNLETAARTLGASNVAAFRKIFLPLSKPAVFAGTMLVFILALGFFVVPSLMGGPHDATIAVFIERQVFFLRWDLASGAAVLLLLVSVIVFTIVDRTMGIDQLFRNVRS